MCSVDSRNRVSREQQAYTNCMCLEIEVKMDSVKKTVTVGTGARECVFSCEVPHPVLITLDTDGQLRVLWEYFKTYSDKTPVYGQVSSLSHEFENYSLFLVAADTDLKLPPKSGLTPI